MPVVTGTALLAVAAGTAIVKGLGAIFGGIARRNELNAEERAVNAEIEQTDLRLDSLDIDRQQSLESQQFDVASIQREATRASSTVRAQTAAAGIRGASVNAYVGGIQDEATRQIERRRSAGAAERQKIDIGEDILELDRGLLSTRAGEFRRDRTLNTIGTGLGVEAAGLGVAAAGLEFASAGTGNNWWRDLWATGSGR